MFQAAEGAETIQPVQFQFQRKGFAHEQPPQGGFAHLFHILELHVVQHAGGDLLRLLVGKSQPHQNLLGHDGPDFFVSVKMNFARCGLLFHCDRLGNVMEQDRPRQREGSIRRHFFEH